MNLKNLNLAEWFALSRLITFPIIMGLVFYGDRTLFAWLYLILFSTDVLDGFFAHFFNMETSRRSKLDSTGDVLYFFAGVFAFYIFEPDYFINKWPWLVVLSVLYSLQFAICMIKFKRPSSFHTYSAKFAAFIQFVFLAWTFFFFPNDFLFYAAFIAGVFESIDEILIAIHLKKWDTNMKGILFIWNEERNGS
jgi:phosphatidylglycerophosphate synthase